MIDAAESIPLLALRGVGKVYEREGAPVHALAGVDLEIGHGAYVALTGASGSGKSTLLHILGCLDSPTAGSYRLAGEELAALGQNERSVRRRGIGFVFQSFHLVPRMTALDNVALPLRYAGVAACERKARAAAMLEKVGLGDRLLHRSNELSGGQQQRVAIARALVADAALLLCDEPTGNLDSKSGAEIVALLEGLWREGRTLLVVTHDPALAARAQRCVRMKDGRIESDLRQAAAGRAPG
ncbi:MAG: ABC transporter ATP-binding protein [Planctomycetes bacterium]|nr:ABC transporter ATP-binding protein [Planctomycetota bacterium]